ncbi:MAG: STAS/SEC14 domain-containing protein [Ginsengibacter sp.]
MIEVMKGLPPHVAAFIATGKITRQDYDEVIYPIVDQVYKDFGKINYLLLLNTPLQNYSAGAWMKDALLGFIYVTEWRKIAIVSEKENIRTFTNVFGKFIPGRSRGFKLNDLELAEKWVSEL